MEKMFSRPGKDWESLAFLWHKAILTVSPLSVWRAYVPAGLSRKFPSCLQCQCG